MSTEIVQATAFKAMQTDLQISMDDVVSAFVSQYENNLFARKKELGAAIKDHEKTLSDIEATILIKVTSKSYETTLPLGLALTIGAGTIDWEYEQVRFKLLIEDSNSKSRYNNTITIVKDKPIPAASIKVRKKILEELTVLRSELSEVLVSLKSVTRKERQVRGRIAIRKLEDSGYANLMQDEELVRLVQIDE
jgi:hypothetical protein